MRYVAILALVTTPATSQPYQIPLKGSVEQRAAYERGQVNQAKFEQKMFVEAGFQPLDDVAAEKRIVKRVLFQDPYMMLPVPGVEIERMANGSITLKVIGPAEKSSSVVVPASAWTRLTSLQGTLFRPKPYVSWDPPKTDAPLPPPPPICHGWIAYFGTADATGLGSGSWAQCGSRDQPELAFATEVARLAVSTRRACKFDEANPFWSFNACFSCSPQR